MGSRDSYVQRNLYEGLSFIDASYQEQVNLRKLHLFGKVDTAGNQILLPRKNTLLSSGLVKLVPKTDVYVFSFLEEAMNDLAVRFSKNGYLTLRGSISEKSSFISLQPKKSVVFWEDEYEKHVSQIKIGFVQFFKNNYKNQDIGDFSSFIKVFESFITESCPYSVFTLKNYLTSRFCDPLVSGMFIEFASADASDDKKKFQDFILDPNFPKLLTETAFHGLIVDKHVPWRFAINPNSVEMQETFEQAGYKNFADFLSQAYIDPTAISFELFVKMVVDTYRKLVYDEPKYLNLTYVDGNPSLTIGERERIMVNNCHPLFDNLGMEKTIRLYLSVRMREANMFATQGEFDGKAQIALNYQKALDLRRAIMYIDEETKTPDLENTKKPEFRI